MKRVAINRKTGIKRNPPDHIVRRRRNSLAQVGKKGRAWNKARAKLKVIFLEMGITSCEGEVAGCFVDDGLGFAHLQKRRNLSPEDLGDPNKVACLCNSCHWFYEKQGEQLMAIGIQAIIDRRNSRMERAA